MFNKFLLFPTSAWFLGSLLMTTGIFCQLWFFRKNSWKVSPEQIVLGFFIIFFLLSFLFRLQPYGWQELVAFTLGPLGYLAAQKNRLFEFFKKYSMGVAWLTSTAAFILSAIGIFSFLIQPFSRLSSVFRGLEVFTTYPNTFAMFLLMIVPFNIFLVHVLSMKRKGLALLAWFMFIVNGTAFFLTFSRGALLALLGSALVTAILLIVKSIRQKIRPQLFLKPLVLLLVSVVIMGFSGIALNELHRSFQPKALAGKIPLTEDIFGRFSDQEKSADQSSDERIQFWKGSLKLIQEYPWSGVGSDGFRFQYPRVQQELLASSTHPHNLFLKLALENGLPAAFCFLLFLVLLFWKNFFVIWHGQDSKNFGWQITILASFIAANLHLMVDYNLNAMLLWLMYFGLLKMMLPMQPLAIFSGKSFQSALTIVVVLFTSGVALLSFWYFLDYRAAKQLETELDSPSPQSFRAVFKSSGPNPFQPLRYELLGQLARKHSLDMPMNDFTERVFEPALQQYPKWAELQAAYARVLFSSGKFMEASKYYQNALSLNRLNDLEWHLEYLKSLQKSDQNSKIMQMDDEYFALMRSYFQKLRFNEHNTVATKNPEAGDGIIKIYLEISPGDRVQIWKNLQQDYKKVWQQEAEKFEQLFT